jgi:superfamily II DNA or RNA helicase
MKTKLLPKQVENVQRLVARLDLPNYSMPGTGKTITTLAAIEALGHDSGVIVAPPIALKMWQRVIQHELGVRAQIVKSSRTPISGDEFLVMTYQIATAKHEALMRQGRKALVFDESHALKTSTSARTQMAFGKATDGEGGIYETSKYCFTLTGTPIERYADDVWAQLRAIQPEILQRNGVLTETQFLAKFTWQSVKQYHPKMRPELSVSGSKNRDVLNDLMYNQIGALRNVMDDVAKDMPEVMFREISVPAVLDKETSAMLKGKTVEQIAALMMMDDPAMSAARRLAGLAKIVGVVQYVADSAAHGSVLVGHWHREFGAVLLRELRSMGVNAKAINGNTSLEEKDQIAQAFNAGEVRVIVGQIASMGVSLNLQELCRHVIIAEDDFSPGRIEQFYKRVWRLGQKNHVQVDFCFADNGVDEAIAGVRERKEADNLVIHRPTVGDT